MKLLDPTRPDDPRFDPHGEQGRRVLAAAKARTAPRRFPRRRLLAGAALVATCVLAVLVLTPAGGPPDARAALTESLDRMRGIDSGIVVMTIAGDRNEVRFDGEDMEWTSAIGTWQRVDGVEYENGKPTGGHTTENSFPDKLVAQVGEAVDRRARPARARFQRARVARRRLRVPRDRHRGRGLRRDADRRRPRAGRGVEEARPARGHGQGRARPARPRG